MSPRVLVAVAFSCLALVLGLTAPTAASERRAVRPPGAAIVSPRAGGTQVQHVKVEWNGEQQQPDVRQDRRHPRHR